ncbi:type VI secretion system tube protein TssD [Algoriphagus sp. A40]|uniref:type VI secretion system tube protein TssD n=1 Tax=Algoriphagus sp. A40 TaxID=1945863 RepID=UPI0009841E00|nr:type VI secretion system tube protein TssD [Algoriphagus sp. A40]OOG77491.1 hypothetical protein B0E43_05165 [Algoriphagus sp. A40]
MALSSYLVVKGQNQGQFKGGSIQKGREGWIEIIAYNHEIQSPYDSSSGMATGKRQHQPLIVWKEIDQSTISLFQALIDNELLTTVELKNFSQNKLGTVGGAGKEVLSYSITLTNARMVGIKSAMLNNKNPELTRYERTEEISFVYEKIEFHWHLGNKTAEDHW